MKKKVMMVLLAAAMAVSAGACGDGKQKDKKDAQAQAGAEEGKQSQADKITYEIAECVTLGEYLPLELSLPNTYKVTKEQVDDYAQSMAEYNAEPIYKDTDKQTVEEGDTANIDYEGKRDGVAFTGGTDTGHNLTIGSGGFIDGFEDGLIGKKVGETVDLDLSFPDPYPPNPDLAGAPVVFTVKINKIVEVDPDAKFELSDAYVKQNYNCETVDEFKEKVKEYLKTDMKNRKQADTRQAAINKLLEICEVRMPDGLLEARVEDHIVQFTDHNCSDGTTLAEYLAEEYEGTTEEDFRADITNEMQVNLQTQLILEAIAAQEGIKLEEEAFQDYVQQQMNVYAYESAEDFYKANGVNAASGEAYERKVFVCNLALDKVVENAKVEYGVMQDDTTAG